MAVIKLNNDIAKLSNAVVHIPPAALTAPVVVTSRSTVISGTTATFIGSVTTDGGSAITERGFAYGTGSTPTTGNTKVVVAGTTGSFTGTTTGLTANQLYYVRAYAVNAKGITYGLAEQNIPTRAKFTFSQVAYTGLTGTLGTTSGGKLFKHTDGYLWGFHTAANYWSLAAGVHYIEKVAMDGSSATLYNATPASTQNHCGVVMIGSKLISAPRGSQTYLFYDVDTLTIGLSNSRGADTSNIHNTIAWLDNNTAYGTPRYTSMNESTYNISANTMSNYTARGVDLSTACKINNTNHIIGSDYYQYGMNIVDGVVGGAGIKLGAYTGTQGLYPVGVWDDVNQIGYFFSTNDIHEIKYVNKTNFTFNRIMANPLAQVPKKLFVVNGTIITISDTKFGCFDTANLNNYTVANITGKSAFDGYYGSDMREGIEWDRSGRVITHYNGTLLGVWYKQVFTVSGIF